VYKSAIFSVVWYGYETWFPKLREEYGLKVFENRVQKKIFGPKRDEIIGSWRKVHNEGLHSLYPLPYIIIMIRSRSMTLAGHVACMQENNTYRVMVGKPEGKIPLGRPRSRGSIILNGS
jgi:hypothetical protein